MGTKFVVLEGGEEINADGDLRHERKIEKSKRGAPAGGFRKIFGPASKTACQDFVDRTGGEQPITPYEAWAKPEGTATA
jgi:hypothetical protein